jgi:hypothetical protein
VNFIPGILSLSIALAITLAGNSLPLLTQGTTPTPGGGPGVHPRCDPPWTFAIMTDGTWLCAGGPGPVILPHPSSNSNHTPAPAPAA